MKTTLLALCLLGSTLASGQSGGRAVSGHSSRSPVQPAAPHALAAERYILAGSHYMYAQGERKVTDLVQTVTEAASQSLGETARILREEHAKVKKAGVVFEN